MSRDLEQLLHDTAVRPEGHVDPTQLVARGRRRRRMRQAGLGVGTAVVVAATALVVVGPMTSPGPPEIVDQPSPRETAATPSPSSPSASPADPSASEPETGSESGDRIHHLEGRRAELLERLSDRLGELARLRGLESELRFRQDQGEEVEEELAELARRIESVRATVGELRREQFAVEEELLQLDALDDPVAEARAAATDADRELTEALVELAWEPSSSTVERVPFAAQVELGLADELHREVERGALAEPDGWAIEAEVFRAYTGPFSALDLLAQDRPTQTLVGEHPHCASPPVPPPPGFEDHRRVSIQPVDGSSCLEWWTVDLFIGDDGTVEAVTMDLYEP